MGNDCEEHTGNLLWELDIRLNSAYTQGHLKATTHAFLTWREKPPPSLSRAHNKMDWTTSGTHLITGCSLNAESSGKLPRRRQRPACYATDFVCAFEASSACLFGVDPTLVEVSPDTCKGLFQSESFCDCDTALNKTEPQVVTQPGKEL